MTNSRKPTKQLNQTPNQAIETQKDLLEQLPDEILLQIIQYVYDARTKIGETYQQMDKQIHTLVSEDLEPLHLYEHKSEAPIISNFHLFSTVNRRIHLLCRPFIWKFLAMPRAISRPASFWNQEILPKYACYVKEFHAMLESEWIQEPLDPLSLRDAWDKDQHYFTFQSCDSNKFKLVKWIKAQGCAPWYKRFKIGPSVEHIHLNDDNIESRVLRSLLRVKMDIVLRERHGLPRKDLFGMLPQCNNLTMLSLELSHHWNSIVSEMLINNLSGNLTALLSNLGQLQHLKYQGPFFGFVAAESIIEPIKHLPLLESLELANVSVTDWARTDGLARSLSNLKNLKHLALMHVDVIDDSWGRDHKAPPQLTKLVIRHYPNPWSLNLPSCISSWAPRITDLELKFDQHEYPEPNEILPNFDPEIHQFSLPALRHLTIYRHSACETFHCFKDCPNLIHLIVRNPSKDGLSEFSNFIICDVFPKLKEIVMPVKCLDSPPDPRLDLKLNRLEDFCKFKGIDFKIAEGFIRRPLSIPKING